MFEDSLIESGNRFKTKRLSTTILSFLLQVGLIGILILIPLIYTDALPKTQLMTFLVCLLYTSDAADDLLCVDLDGRRIIKKKTQDREILAARPDGGWGRKHLTKGQ